jgi:hypothetical protein
LEHQGHAWRRATPKYDVCQLNPVPTLLQFEHGTMHPGS